MKKNLVVLQEGNKDCGSAALLSIIRYYGGDISIDRLIEMTKTTKDGTNFYNMSIAINNLGLISKCYQVDDVEKIKKIKTPFIVQFNNKNYTHFVVVYKVEETKVLIMDPAKGKVILDIFDFASNWTGYIMLFEKVHNLPFIKQDKVLNKILISSLLKNKNIIISLITLSLIFTILSCITSMYSQVIFDKISDINNNSLFIITFIFSILYIVKNITNFIRNHLIIYLNQKIDISIILSTFSKVILLPFYYYKNKTTSEVLSRINDLSYLKTFISKIIITTFLDSFTFIVSAILIYKINQKILLILLIMSLIYLIIILIFNKVIKSLTYQHQENLALINTTIIESVSSFETIKGLNIEDNIIFKFTKNYSKSLNTTYQSEKTNNIMLILKEITTDLGILSINFLSIKLILNNMITTGNYMTITFLSGYLIYPIRNLIDILNEYHYSKSAIRRANNLLEVSEEEIFQESKLKVNGNIKIKNLSYTYDNKNNILNNINFYINDKERVLLLGPSGSGKSTILKLLYKYYKSPRDKIFINNYDINDYSMSDIRKNITYISQNEMLFTDTIRNNIVLDRDISETKYLDICKLTYVDDIVKDNILGYNYMLEENGVNISGGQRQRIILARSLLKNSNIIMIDEGLNQIDINLERKILKNIFYYFYDKTFIIISHRCENMDLYNRIIKLNNNGVENLERIRNYE